MDISKISQSELESYMRIPPPTREFTFKDFEAEFNRRYPKEVNDALMWLKLKHGTLKNLKKTPYRLSCAQLCAMYKWYDETMERKR